MYLIQQTCDERRARFCARTLTSGFSARRRATTEPEEPDPQMMKS
jgi:hypothetical protein